MNLNEYPLQRTPVKLIGYKTYIRDVEVNEPVQLTHLLKYSLTKREDKQAGLAKLERRIAEAMI